MFNRFYKIIHTTISICIFISLLSNLILLLGPGMIIPAARRLFKGAQLTSSPRLMEPIYLCEITTNREGLNGIRSVLTKRRGKILEEIAINGTPLNLIKVIYIINILFICVRHIYQSQSHLVSTRPSDQQLEVWHSLNVYLIIGK